MVNPFVFRNGEEAMTVAELVVLCTRYPGDALYHFTNGHFEPWLTYIGLDNIAEIAKQARENAPDAPQDGLADFLAAVKVADIPTVTKEDEQTEIESEALPTEITGEEESTSEGESPVEKDKEIDTGRWVCPNCGNNDRRMIREQTDKSIILNVYPPVYGKKLACGQCGEEWHHK